MEFNIFSKNGKVLPITDATVSLLSVEYAYGFGVYETLRVSNKKALFLEDHVERLLKSAEIIKLNHSLSGQDIQQFTNNLIAKTDVDTYNMKMLLIGATKPEDVSFYIFCSNPLFVDKKLYRDGIKTITAQYERSYPHSKSLNMLGSYIAYRDAKQHDCYDAILVNRDGNITEGTRTNFFTIKGNVIYSPPEKDILLGVTRKNIIEVAKNNGFVVEEQNISLASLKDYDGAFLTSTSTKIVPIKKINDFEYGEIPDSLKKLMLVFDEYLSGLK